MGNPLAVIADAEDLDTETMQRIARWTNLSETVFLLPPKHPEADYHLRIFTPGGELPFAGHPTLGAAHAWLVLGGEPKDPDYISQECEAGIVRVRREAEKLFFAAPPTLRTGPIEADYLDHIVQALGITHEEVIDHQWIDNGPGWAAVRLASADAVLALEPDLSGVPNGMIGALGAYPEGAPHQFELRAFAPALGVAEDPVCGSMNASVGQWLARTGEAGDGYTVSQGTRLQRAGEITVRVEDLADQDSQVWVGGNVQTLFKGSAVI